MRWRDDFEALQKLFSFRRALCDGVLQGEVNKRHWRKKKMAKKDTTEKVEWEFNGANTLRAGKVTMDTAEEH